MVIPLCFCHQHTSGTITHAILFHCLSCFFSKTSISLFILINNYPSNNCFETETSPGKRSRRVSGHTVFLTKKRVTSALGTLKLNLVLVRKLQLTFPNISITLSSQKNKYINKNSFILKLRNWTIFPSSFPQAQKFEIYQSPKYMLFLYLCHHHIRKNYSYNFILDENIILGLLSI